ncbi:MULTISPECIES: alanine racemase [Spiroplasma]|uniref:alanine racemase n=1 Tax=Spiroplasma TaxID=2132 RepID=UPI0018DC831C|nr:MULTISPECIES: alanine racemase [Spiroplasma]MBH8623400.1 alanine/ornithine racemase family PLP-dependent enzyme [Spiroplasma sp. hyd1]UNF62447.1 alanine racemase [Spiroplasma poulsonii]
MYPKLIWNLPRIKTNCQIMVQECTTRNLDLVGVVKLGAGQEKIVSTLIESGIKTIADSRILNLQQFVHFPVRKMLLRLPMLSEVTMVVNNADCVLVSELATIKALNQAAQIINKKFEIILMIETGDIREGLWDEALIFQTVKAVLSLSHIKLTGLGTNFACFGATVPTVKKLNQLANLKQQLEQHFNIMLPIISCGNSSHITIWDNPQLDRAINQIRSGTALLMGLGLNDEPIPFLQQDNLWLEAEIIELQTKPSASIGARGLDAFGRVKEFDDVGNRVKAIIALGRQDCPFEELTPFEKGITILGQSSDHTILDVADYQEQLAVGSIIKFKTTYLANLMLGTSCYVQKEFLE